MLRLLPVLLMLLAACAPRPPLTRSQVSSDAFSYLLREGLTVWGDPIEVLEPDATDAQGKRWWQVRYKDGPSAETRLVLVDDATRWARLPVADYHPRITAKSRSGTSSGAHLVAGTWIVQATGSQLLPADQRASLLGEVAELNRLAERTGLHPAFSLRESRDGAVAIVYGWQNGGGTVHDEQVIDWIRLRTRFDQPVWVDLSR